MRYTELSCLCKRQEHVCVEPTKYRSSCRNPGPQVRKYLQQIPCEFNENLLRSVVEETKKYFSDIFYDIRPYHFNDRLDDLATSTSPGLYFKRKGYQYKKDVLEDESARAKLRFTGHRIKTGCEKRMEKYPCNVVVVDAKVSATELKTRVAWVYPLEITALENMFFAGIKDRLPEDWVPTPEVYHPRMCGKYSASADYGSFDTSVPQRILLEAVTIMHSWFNFSRYEGGARPYSQTSLERLYDWLMDYFIWTPFVIDGKPEIHRKSKGVPSGSMFTNVINTICSRIITTYLHRYLNCNATISTYGDDVHWRDCSCKAELLEKLALTLGMTLKVEKPNEHNCLTYCKAECHLGHAFHPGLWFRNILNCASAGYESDVAECMLHYEPTRLQSHELKTFIRKKAKHYHSTFLRWKFKLEEFWPRLSKRISVL